jgi:hypothetical protein
MLTCNNCKGLFNEETDKGLVVRHGKVMAAAICPGCVEGVAVAKLVVRRTDTGGFNYEQYAALSMVDKAFGKKAG